MLHIFNIDLITFPCNVLTFFAPQLLCCHTLTSAIHSATVTNATKRNHPWNHPKPGAAEILPRCAPLSQRSLSGMFSFLRRNVVAELVVLVVESEYNEQFSMTSHVIVSVPTKIQLHELKKRICGVTGVPPERIMLMFCGQILTIEKEYVPLETFEPSEIVDEDHLSFIPRLCMRIIDDPVIRVPEEEEDAERRRPVTDDDADKGQTKLKHRHKHKSKGDFDIEKELGGEVNCVAFVPVLRKAGYDNEVR